ncbi:UNVERIFIED_CONTAM: hypothetical protein Sindi_2177800 [Sesamum indicum]
MEKTVNHSIILLFQATLLLAMLLQVSGTPTHHKLVIGRLPKGVPIPPSGPSGNRNIPPPAQPLLKQKMIFGKFPKGVPIRPSGPSSGRHIPRPPPPPLAQ